MFKTQLKATYRAKKFKKINWLPTKERVEQRIATKVFNYWKGTSPLYVNELFGPSRGTYNTSSHMALEIPSKKSNLGQNSISFIGPSIWNKLSNNLKVLNTTSSFTHNYEKLVLQTSSAQNSVLIITFNHYYYYYYYQKTYYWYYYYFYHHYYHYYNYISIHYYYHCY